MATLKPTEQKPAEIERGLGLKKKPPAPSARERKPSAPRHPRQPALSARSRP
jgi:hypothetical protein